MLLKTNSKYISERGLLKMKLNNDKCTTKVKYNAEFRSEIISASIRYIKKLEWFMYIPVFNSKEKARELVDIVREQTDAPIGTCIDTVSVVLSSLLRDLPDIYSLHVIKNALEKDDIIDVDNCYDARVLDQLTASITSHIEDKGQVCIA